MTARHRIITAAIALLLILGMGYAAEQDRIEHDKALARYCDMVALGYWPDYLENAERVCTSKLPQLTPAGRE